MSEKLIIVGIGNTILRDEGVGIRVLEALREETLPADVELIEAGTASLDILAGLNVEKVIVIDAVRGGKKPGTIYRFDVEEARGAELSAQMLSLHQISFLDSLALARLGGARIGSVMVIGIEPEKIEPGLELTETLGKQVPAAVEAVKSEIETFRDRDGFAGGF